MATEECTSEEWRPIGGMERFYEVSNLGRVRSVRWGTIRRPAFDKHGYPYVNLVPRNGRSKRRKIHILVLDAFVGPCPPGLVCCHWNDDPTDNRIENLRWDSRKSNFADSRRNGILPVGERVWCAKLTGQQVVEIRSRRESGELLRAIAASFGVEMTTIWKICKGARWKHLS
jgi:hypothetical protein